MPSRKAALTINRGRGWRPGFLLIVMCVCASTAAARGVYQTPADFIAGAFNGRAPMPKQLWLDAVMQRDVAGILGHRYAALRVRYWAESGRSAWVLDEIGKDEPITVGVIVQNNAVKMLKVLVFRESRGDEVRHPFFTDQFAGARLRDGRALSKPIDSVSGATLSARALERLARLALYFHAHSDFDP